MTTKPAPSPQFLAAAEALGLTPEQYAEQFLLALEQEVREIGTRNKQTLADRDAVRPQAA